MSVELSVKIQGFSPTYSIPTTVHFTAVIHCRSEDLSTTHFFFFSHHYHVFKTIKIKKKKIPTHVCRLKFKVFHRRILSPPTYAIPTTVYFTAVIHCRSEDLSTTQIKKNFFFLTPLPRFQTIKKTKNPHTSLSVKIQGFSSTYTIPTTVYFTAVIHCRSEDLSTTQIKKIFF
jgi:hypothetical protein